MSIVKVPQKISFAKSPRVPPLLKGGLGGFVRYGAAVPHGVFL